MTVILVLLLLAAPTSLATTLHRSAADLRGATAGEVSISPALAPSFERSEVSAWPAVGGAVAEKAGPPNSMAAALPAGAGREYPVGVSVATIPVGRSPSWATLDTENGYLYVENAFSNNVSVINRTTVVASVAVGADPCWATYDSGNGYLYVPNYNDSTVTIINGTKVIGTVRVGTNPCYSDYDAKNGWVYVPNYGSDNVSVINGTKIVGSFTTGTGSTPWDATFDSRNGYVYITDGGTNSVSVVNGLKVIQSIAVGSTPVWTIYDPLNGYLYVPNLNSANTTVINGTTVIGSANTGTGSGWATVDTRTGLVYVPNLFAFLGRSSNVSVINGTTPIASVAVGANAVYSTFDSRNGLVYVPNSGSDNVSLLDGTTVVDSVNVGGGPDMAAYDDTTGFVYVTNPRTNNVSVLVTQPTYGVTFTESGLPAATAWTVTFAGGRSTSTAPSIEFVASNSTFGYSVGDVPGWTTASFSGSITVNGTSTVVTLDWTRVTYGANFAEDGLPSGTTWTVDVTGFQLASSAATSISVTEPNGTYAYFASTTAPGFAAPRGTVHVSGGAVWTHVTFIRTTFVVGFSEAGLPVGSVWWVNFSGGESVFSGSNALSVSEPNGTYRYFVSTTDKTRVASGGTFMVADSPTTVTVIFVPVTWNVTLASVGLPTGVHWSASVGGTTRSGAGDLTFPGLVNGTYPFSIGAVSGYLPESPAGRVTVAGADVSVSIPFAAIPRTTYLVTFVETGLLLGWNFSVTLNQTSMTSSTGSLSFSEPNGSYAFIVAYVSGFAVDRSTGTVVIRGHPVSTQLNFARIGVPATGSTASSTLLGLPDTEGLAVLGAAVAVAVALTFVLSFRRDRGPPGGDAASAYEPAYSEGPSSAELDSSVAPPPYSEPEP